MQKSMQNFHAKSMQNFHAKSMMCLFMATLDRFINAKPDEGYLDPHADFHLYSPCCVEAVEFKKYLSSQPDYYLLRLEGILDGIYGEGFFDVGAKERHMICTIGKILKVNVLGVGVEGFYLASMMHEFLLGALVGCADAVFRELIANIQAIGDPNAVHEYIEVFGVLSQECHPKNRLSPPQIMAIWDLMHYLIKTNSLSLNRHVVELSQEGLKSLLHQCESCEGVYQKVGEFICKS